MRNTDLRVHVGMLAVILRAAGLPLVGKLFWSPDYREKNIYENH